MSNRSCCNFSFSPPDNLAGMKCLDRTVFKKVFRIPALRIDTKLCSLFLRQLQRNLLNQPRIKNIMSDPQAEKGKKVLLLNPSKKISQWTLQDRDFVHNQGAEEIEFDLELSYEHWPAEEILRAILPAEITEVPSAFETIGHIAHVNLREAHTPFKDIIGQVIMDKNSPQIKTVVNKLNTIDTTFRFFKMEVLAGDRNMQTSVKEHGCVYEFDFSKVYWNSRLQTEHKRLVDKFTPSDVVCDMFSGVGPFAIPAAKKGCLVYANDLNPESYKALCHNTRINRIEHRVKPFNMDGREFVKNLVTDWSKPKQLGDETKVFKDTKLFTQVIMNLPASAVEFLDIFRGLLTPFRGNFISSESNSCALKLPQIHCYCFSKSLEPIPDAKLQVEEVLGVTLPSDCDCFYVRDVAPQKAMICVTFVLPENVALMDNNQDSFKRPMEEDDIKNCKEIKLTKDDGSEKSIS